MADETSRLQVEVDGTRAAGDIDRISAAFRRLEGVVGRTQSAFRSLGGSAASAFARMRVAGARAFRALGAGFRGLRRVAGTFMNTFRSLLKVFLGAGAAFALFSRSVLETGNSINKFVNTLVILKGGTAEAVAELEVLFALSNKLGANFVAAATPFTKFAAAAAGALTDSGIREVFEAFATVGVALQLTQSEVTGVFLALQQIASKGVVSMEELRLQLAERVPGAMRLAAQAMDMSMRDFEKAVQERTINASEFLEKFAKKLKDVYGDAALIAADRLFADIQRLGNAFTAFKVEIFQAGFEEGLRDLVRSAAAFLNDNPELSNALGRFSEQIFTRIADFLDNLSADRVISILNTVIGAMEALINALQQVAFWIKRAFDDSFNESLQTVTAYTNGLNRLITERNEQAAALAGLRIIENNVFSRDIDRPMNPSEIIQYEDRLTEMNAQIEITRGKLVAARMEAREFGVVLADLPSNMFENIPSGSGAGPTTITIPRIEPLPEQRGDQGISIRDTAPQDPKMTGALQDALQTAERLLTMGMPEFFDKIVTGELVAGMDDLARVQREINMLNVTQGTTMTEIVRLQTELQEMYNLPEQVQDSALMNEAARKLTANTLEYLKAQEKLNELKEEQLKLLEKEEQRLANLTSFQRTLEDGFTSVQDVAINMAKKTEDAIVSMVTTGKASFSDLANSIVADLTRMAVQAFFTRFILGPILGIAADALGGALAGSFDTLNTGGQQAPIASSPSYTRPPPTLHTGGIIGTDSSGHSAFGRLKTNEQSIIVEKGEGVFTAAQMKALAPTSRMRPQLTGNMGPPVAPVINVAPARTNVEIINNTSEEATVDTTRSPDGSELTRVIVGAVGENIARDGDLSKLLRGKFGLKTRTGLR